MAEQKEQTVDQLFAKLEAAKDAKSMLKKYCTKEVFNKLKDVKTKHGCDFRSCIKSGIDNLDSGIGVYASDFDAYVVFSDLLNPIIMDYHKLKSLDGFAHPQQNFSFDESFPADLDPDNKFIISTRVRVARNVDGYPLRGGMSEKQTFELEAKLKAILEGFTDPDLKGKYYPLEGMDEKTRKQLVDDHFLFKKGDRFLASAGINNFWPKGRGIFFNTAKTFLVWVNEEDQLRIISMEQGANIKAVFNRLEKAVKAINEKLQFAYNKQLGYLTACPTNIGCGERASVHIKVPLTSQKKDLFNDIAKRNNLQIRGIHGEHSESSGGIYDVSNKRRLGITEWDGVKDLINGCKELIESETKLQKEQGGYDDEKEEKKEEEVDTQIVDALYEKLENATDSKSLLKKYLTRQIFDKLKSQKTEQGCDLQSCIQSGIDNLDSGTGIYASDSDAYVVFSDLFNPIIMDYHKLDSLDGFKHPKQNFVFNDSFPADLDPDGKFIISTRVRVARNVNGYPLRGGMNEQQTMELEQKLKDILEGFDDEDLKGKYYPLVGMDESTRKQLVEDHFLFKKGDRFLESAGINNFWPNGRGIFFNNNKTFLVWVNEEDQLRIISMEQGANIKAVFNRLEKAVKAINEKLQFAYNKQLGYLTACPTNIGCGERASVHIKVPLTSQKKDLFNDIAKRNNLQIRGIHGEHSESSGGIYDVSNKRRLGITEWDGVKDLINGCKELIESESKLQAESGGDEKKEEEKEQTEIALNATLAKNEYPAEELKKCKSTMSKYLTKELFDKLKELKTKNGFMLKNALNTGVKNPQSLMGIHAGDIESYSLLGDIFTPCITDYHQTKTFHKGIKSSFSADCEEKLEINPGDIPNMKNIRSTRIRVARNIAGFPLAPGQTSVKIKLEIEELMKKVFAELQSDSELKGTYYSLYGMDEKIRQKFIDDHFLFSGNDDPMQTDSGYHLWFPKGRGIYLNEAKTFIIWLNEGDHLRLISMEKGNKVKNVFDRLRKAVLAVEAGLKKVSAGKHDGFLFDETYGNITCCPTNLGTGLRGSVHIEFPKLCKQGLDKLNDIGIKYKVQIRGLYGEHSEIEDNGVIDISNKFRMGYSELSLVQFMCDGVNILNKMETD
eukprot:846766_1